MPQPAPRPLGFRSEAGFTLAELMIVVAIIAVLAATQAPRLIAAYKTAQSAEAIQTSGMIVQKVKEYVDTHTTVPIDTLNSTFRPGSGRMGNLNSGVDTDEITNIIPTLKSNEDFHYRYEVTAEVQTNRDVRICVKSYRPDVPEAFILYSSKESSKIEWEGHFFRNTFIDETVPAVAGGYCDANGGVGADAG